jgi:chromosomal replication initiator protein
VANFTSDQNEFLGTGIWQSALMALQERIKPHNYDMWLRPIECLAVEETTITLRAPNRYIKEWFEDNYLSIVLQEIRNRTQREFQVSFQVDEPEVEPVSAPSETPSFEQPKSGWEYELNERFTFDSFVVGPSNQLAHAATMAVAEIPAGKYNPLFIYGGVGLGKTHLLCAIGHEIKRKNPRFRVAYLSSERFMNEYINFLKTNRIEAFRNKFREECDILLMDDIQFIAGKDRTQEEFFHTFNTLYDSQRQIVVTSDKYPHEIPDLEDRIRTRFQWGLIADIQQPELETRVAILKKKADVEHIALPDDVALYLATHIKSNVRELEGSLIRVAALASLKSSEISVDFAKESLKNFLSHNSAHLTIETVQKEVAAYHNIKVSDLKSAKRHKTVARPRQIAMYLCRKLIKASYPEIGQRFGGKDHSTVISAFKKITNLIEHDLTVRTIVETLERQLHL